MILTTTNSIEGFRIAEYRGIVTGTAVNMQKMKMTFNLQKYYAGISESVSEVKDQAFEQLKANAEQLNANAVVGIAIDTELMTSNYVAVTVTGTAVRVVQR